MSGLFPAGAAQLGPHRRGQLRYATIELNRLLRCALVPVANGSATLIARHCSGRPHDGSGTSSRAEEHNGRGGATRRRSMLVRAQQLALSQSYIQPDYTSQSLSILVRSLRHRRVAESLAQNMLAFSKPWVDAFSPSVAAGLRMPIQGVATAIRFDQAPPPAGELALGCFDRIPTFDSIRSLGIFEDEIRKAERNGMRSVRITYQDIAVPLYFSINKARTDPAASLTQQFRTSMTACRLIHSGTYERAVNLGQMLTAPPPQHRHHLSRFYAVPLSTRLQLDCGRSIPFGVLAELHGDTWLSSHIPSAVLAVRYTDVGCVIVPPVDFSDAFARQQDGEGIETVIDEFGSDVRAGGAAVRFVPVVYNSGAHWIGLLVDLFGATVSVYNSLGAGREPTSRVARAARALGELFDTAEASRPWRIVNASTTQQLDSFSCGPAAIEALSGAIDRALALAPRAGFSPTAVAGHRLSLLIEILGHVVLVRASPRDTANASQPSNGAPDGLDHPPPGQSAPRADDFDSTDSEIEIVRNLSPRKLSKTTTVRRHAIEVI